MTDPFIGEVRMVAFNFPPKYWAFCNGQIMQINQNQTLYAILGSTYGGDGRATYGLPDLRGRAPLGFGTSPHWGTPYPLGLKSGQETVTLTPAQLPSHSHSVTAACDNPDNPVPLDPKADMKTAVSNLPASLSATKATPFTTKTTHLTPLDENAVETAGGGQAHYNIQPSLAVHFCISLQGLFPSRN